MTPLARRLLPLLVILPTALFADEPGKQAATGEATHWSYIPPDRPAPPAVRDEGWIRNPIDRFILAKLEASGASPAPEADRATLLRRLSFDLIGLPPAPEEVERFLADESPLAYEREVDRLMASPRHGERWAQHWLDLARYADTDGFEFDHARPDAWRYRDWVVDALNRDVRYDDFVRLQLAGDELRPGDPSAFIATGFNRCYPDMVDLNDQGLRRQNALNDITETTGLVFLGLTIGCARCHDHKFDPISQSDFYRLQAFFTPSRFRDDYPLATEAEILDRERDARRREDEATALRAALLRLERPIRSLLAPGLPPGLDDRTADALRKPEAGRSPEETRLAFEATEKDRRIPAHTWGVVLDPASASIRGSLRARLAKLREEGPPPLPRARGIDEDGRPAPPTYILRRGEFSLKGAEVSPGVPDLLCAGGRAPMPPIEPGARSTGRRRALAEWIVHPENPLTARVMVNRLWQEHFGGGIVATPSDFGAMGAEPSHPELLDWLAVEFVRGGWNLKALHRLMVTSATYRQSSRPAPSLAQADPEDALLGHFRRRRLDGEAIRDALLAVSGRLSLRAGGPGIFPELPEELAGSSGKRAPWPVSHSAEERSRRSLYVFVRRNLRFPFFEAFDRPDTNASCPLRARTTIAPQALTLMNGRLSLESARGLAARVGREAGEGAKIERAYLIALGRPPDRREMGLAGEYLREGGGLADLCLVLLNLNEFVSIE